MNILISVDSNYLNPAKVMLKSLSLHNQEEIIIYLLYNNISRPEMIDFAQFLSYNCHAVLYPIYVEKKRFEDLPLGHQFTVEIYFRLLAAEILPENVDRVLWLDADIIVLDSISEYYYTNIENKAIAVIPDTGSSNQVLNGYKENLGIGSEYPYYNSGVILFNLDYIRKNSTKFNISEALEKYGSKLKMPDQDILNLIFRNDSITMPEKYNFQIRYNSDITYDDYKGKATIIHYIGKVKPWNLRYRNSCKWEYWKIAKKIKIAKYLAYVIGNPIMMLVENVYVIIRRLR